MLAGRLDDARALFADDYLRIDRRSVVSMPTQGPEGIYNFAVIADLGITAIDFEPIAVRGDRCSLSRRTYRYEHGDTSTLLVLGEANELGEATLAIYFDEDDIEAAIDELDARFLGGVGAAHAEVYASRGSSSTSGVRSKDADAITRDSRPTSSTSTAGPSASDRVGVTCSSRARVRSTQPGSGPSECSIAPFTSWAAPSSSSSP